MKRRTLLKLVTLSSISYPFSIFAKKLNEVNKNKHIILIELKGGNDGLNTIIPYNDPLYYKYRKNIAISKKKVLKINEDIAFHPALKDLKNIYDKKELCIFQGLGYENANRSHFRSIEIWNTASKHHEYLDTGWIENVNFPSTQNKNAVVLSGGYGPLTASDSVIKISNISKFLKQAKKFGAKNYNKSYKNNALGHILKIQNQIKDGSKSLSKKLKNAKELKFPFKKNNFAKQSELLCKLINANANIGFYKLSLGSFDTHQYQLKAHEKLLHNLSTNLNLIRKNLLHSGEWENTIIMTYSEFGRRVKINSSKGTDHGTASVQFVLGGNIQGGLKGKYPSLNNLDDNYDLKYTTHFKEMYEFVISNSFQKKVS